MARSQAQRGRACIHRPAATDPSSGAKLYDKDTYVTEPTSSAGKSAILTAMGQEEPGIEVIANP
jgi:hypothetical protein